MSRRLNLGLRLSLEVVSFGLASITWSSKHLAPAHRTQETEEFFRDSQLYLIEHPLYSPDLTPCEFELCPCKTITENVVIVLLKILDAWNQAGADVCYSYFIFCFYFSKNFTSQKRQTFPEVIESLWAVVFYINKRGQCEPVQARTRSRYPYAMRECSKLHRS